MSGKLIGIKSITSSIGYSLPSLARKNDPTYPPYQNAEKALAYLQHVFTSLKSDLFRSPEWGF